jgi:hypothetical protein
VFCSWTPSQRHSTSSFANDHQHQGRMQRCSHHLNSCTLLIYSLIDGRIKSNELQITMASCRQRTRSIVVKHKDMVEIPMSVTCTHMIDTSLKCCPIDVSLPNSSATSMRNDDHDHARTRLVRIECGDKTSQPSSDDNECRLFESILRTFEHDIVEQQRSSQSSQKSFRAEMCRENGKQSNR